MPPSWHLVANGWPLTAVVINIGSVPAGTSNGMGPRGGPSDRGRRDLKQPGKALVFDIWSLFEICFWEFVILKSWRR